MAARSVLKLSPLVLAFWSTCAMAQEQGTTSGPAAGTNVEPNTAIQKQSQSTGRAGATSNEWKASSEAAGVPGIEGKPGTEGGPLAQEQAAPLASK